MKLRVLFACIFLLSTSIWAEISEWSSTVTYSQLDTIIYENLYYEAQREVTLNTPPISSDNGWFWKEIEVAEKVEFKKEGPDILVAGGHFPKVIVDFAAGSSYYRTWDPEKTGDTCYYYEVKLHTHFFAYKKWTVYLIEATNAKEYVDGKWVESDLISYIQDKNGEWVVLNDNATIRPNSLEPMISVVLEKETEAYIRISTKSKEHNNVKFNVRVDPYPPLYSDKEEGPVATGWDHAYITKDSLKLVPNLD